MDEPTYYSLRQLTDLTGWSKPRVRRLLHQARVPLRRVGNRDLVFVRDLARAFPELAESLALVEEVRRITTIPQF
jgi:hypothetical protein